MRQDLNKVLCEHERYRSSETFAARRKAKKFTSNIGSEGENLFSRESMRLRYGYERKSFSENLSPLYGAVRKAVGTRWDKFYSELCSTFDKRSVINQHILQHLNDFISVKTFLQDGDVCVVDSYYGPRPIKTCRTEFFVDPRDGIIKKNKWYTNYKTEARKAVRQRKAEESKTYRKLSDTLVLALVDGVWFEFELQPVPQGQTVYEKPANKEYFKPYGIGKDLSWDMLTLAQKQRLGVPKFTGKKAKDLFTGETVYCHNGYVYRSNVTDHKHRNYDGNLYHATKKTASHKTLKKAGLI